MNALLTLFMAACFLVVGWHCLKRPVILQQGILQLQQKNPLVAEMNPLRKWIDKKSFVWALQLLGGLSLLNGVMLLSTLFVTPGSDAQF